MNRRWLIGCEESARVRDEMRRRGVDAWSCDTKPTRGDPRYHIQGDVLDYLNDGWFGAVFHPPCTYVCNSGAKHLYLGMKKENGPNPERWAKMREGAEFFRKLWEAPIPRIAIENPIMLGYAKAIVGAEHSQIVQPWMFGEGEIKATCFWLKNLPPLVPTNIVSGRVARIHKMAPGPNRGAERSVTYQGIANAIGDQWGTLALERAA